MVGCLNRDEGRTGDQKRQWHIETENRSRKTAMVKLNNISTSRSPSNGPTRCN